MVLKRTGIKQGFATRLKIYTTICLFLDDSLNENLLQKISVHSKNIENKLITQADELNF